MDNKSPFTDDWRESLQEHYKDVVRRNDALTEKTLVGVLHDVGFTDDMLRELKLEATMRAEDLADDFVPDLDAHLHDHSHEHHHEEVEEPEPQVHSGVTLEPPDEDDMPPTVEEEITEGEALNGDEAVEMAGADGNITVIEKATNEANHEDDTEDESDASVDTASEVGDTPDEDDQPEDDADAPQQISMF